LRLRSLDPSIGALGDRDQADRLEVAEPKGGRRRRMSRRSCSLCPLEKGNRLQKEAKLKEGKTSAPKPYDDASLLTAMKNAVRSWMMRISQVI